MTLVQNENLARAVVTVNVGAEWERLSISAIDISAGYGASAAPARVHIFMNGADVILRIAGGRAELRTESSFKHTLTAIFARLDNVNFLGGALPNVDGIKFSGERIKRETPWVSQSVGVDFVAAALLF